MRTDNENGFTLIELMITVAIIGILASVATPLFQRYKLKSRTAEAKVNLEAISTSEQAYQAEFDCFRICVSNPSAGVPGRTRSAWDTGTNFEEIGFAPKDADVYYQYSVAVGGTGDIKTSFNATATGNLDGDANNAVFQVTESDPVDQSSSTNGYY